MVCRTNERRWNSINVKADSFFATGFAARRMLHAALCASSLFPRGLSAPRTEKPSRIHLYACVPVWSPRRNLSVYNRRGWLRERMHLTIARIIIEMHYSYERYARYFSSARQDDHSGTKFLYRRCRVYFIIITGRERMISPFSCHPSLSRAENLFHSFPYAQKETSDNETELIMSYYKSLSFSRESHFWQIRSIVRFIII